MLKKIRNSLARIPGNVQWRPGSSLKPWFIFPSILFCVFVVPLNLFAGDQSDFPLLALSDWAGYFEFNAENAIHSYDDQNSSLESSRDMFSERLSLETNGCIYHPNLFDFHISSLFGYTNDNYSGNGMTYRTSSEVYGYDFTANILKNKVYGASLLSRKSQHRVSRPFLPSYQLDTTEHGITFRGQNAFFHSNLDISKIKNIFKNYDPIAGTARTVEDLRIQFETEIFPNDTNSINITYGYMEHDDSFLQSRVETTDLRLFHELFFGEDLADRLISSYRYYEYVGKETHQFHEQLHLVHTEKLRSQYSYGHENDTASKSTRDAVSAQVQHQLYESLTSRLSGNLQRIQINNITNTDSLGGNASLSYRKSNPWGNLTLNYSYGYQKETNDVEEGSLISVLDEGYSFSDPMPVILTSPQIDISSIVITDLSGAQFYVIGVDYNVLTLPDRVEISRIPIGNITNGQTVLIDYNYQPRVNTETITQTNYCGIRHQFNNGLYLNYTYGKQDVQINPKPVVPQGESITQTYGAGVRKGAFYLDLTYENNRSNYSNNTYRANTGYNMRFSPYSTTSLSANWSRINHTGQTKRITDLYIATLGNQVRISNNLEFTSLLMYRNEVDTFYDDIEGVDFSAGLNWYHRKTSVKIDYYSKFYNSQTFESRTNEVRLTLKRVF